MKLVLSRILYYIGHLISLLMRWNWLGAILYPVYSKIMNLSCDLDPDGKVWKIVNKKKLSDL